MANRIRIGDVLLGRGQFSSVFSGTFTTNGIKKEVAIKQVLRLDLPQANDFERFHRIQNNVIQTINNQREEEALRNLCHPNIIKFFYSEEDNEYKYFVLERCACSLKQYCQDEYSGPPFDLPPDAVVFLHITRGLRYMHSHYLVHRNIRPENILISLTSPVLIKLTDFGLCKPVSGRGSCSFSGNVGLATCWMPSEMLDDQDDEAFSEKRGSIASDTFSAGCVFFYFLTCVHPFGNEFDIKLNIKTGNAVHVLEYQHEDRLKDFIELIKKMILIEPDERIGLESVETELQAILGDYDEPRDYFERPDYLM